MNRHIAATILALACTACVPAVINTSAVTPSGNGAYLVVGKPSYNTNWNDIRFKTLEVAEDYCAEQGKRMRQVGVKTHGNTKAGGQDYQLTFECSPSKADVAKS